MKRCPECGRQYDNTMSFCLDDGAELLYGPVRSEPGPVATGFPSDEPATAILPESGAVATGFPAGESPTRVQIQTTDQPSSTAGAEVEPQDRGGTLERESPSERQSFSTAAEPPDGVGFDKRLIAIPLLLAIILLGGFVGYKYFAPARQIESIAVMPFVNESGDSEFDYLSDGMTETLINSLSELPQLSVKARSLVFRYKGKDVDSKQVATDLGVQAVLNGRVVKRGDSIALSLDLVDAATGNQIWGETYERKIADILTLQKEIARDVSNKLKTKLSGADEQNLAKSHTVDPEAYQLYLQGRYQWNRRTLEGVEKAREYFQKAIDKDPRYALSYVGLGDSYIVGGNTPPAEANPKAKMAGLKALELDPSLGEAHAVLANVAFFYEYDWPTAERGYKRAIELSPNYATAHHWFGETLSAVGRFDESFAEYKRATELDPVSPAISSDLGLAYFNARQFDRAEEHLKKLIELDPSFIRSYFYLATVYEEMGKFPEAIEIRRTGLLRQERDAARVEALIARLKTSLANSGEAGYWKTTLELTNEAGKRDGVPPNPVDMAALYAKLHDRDKAFEWLEKAYRERSSGLVFLNTDPIWDNLRGDLRFGELVQRVGLPRG